MKQLQMLKAGPIALSLNAWKAMPKQSKTPEGYTLKVNGAELKAPEVMLTGGGAFPAYTYINYNNEVKWFAGHFESGTAVEVIEPKVAAATPATPVEQPKTETTPAPAAEATKGKNKKHPNQK